MVLDKAKYRMDSIAAEETFQKQPNAFSRASGPFPQFSGPVPVSMHDRTQLPASHVLSPERRFTHFPPFTSPNGLGLQPEMRIAPAFAQICKCLN